METMSLVNFKSPSLCFSDIRLQAFCCSVCTTVASVFLHYGRLSIFLQLLFMHFTRYKFEAIFHFPRANDESLYTFSISGCIFRASELLRLQFCFLCIKLVHSYVMLCSQAFNIAAKMADVQFVLASSFPLS